MTIPAGAQYWVLVDGVRTACTYLKPATIDGQTMHLIAVPAEAMDDPSPRDREVRSAQGETRMQARIMLVRNTSGFRRTPAAQYEYHAWAAPPRLDDLMAIVERDPRALPLLQAGDGPARYVVSDAAPEEAEDSEADLARAAAALRAPVPAKGTEGQTAAGATGDGGLQEVLARLDELKRGQDDAQRRLLSLETGTSRTRRPSTGVFESDPAARLGQAELDLIAEMRQLRPPGVGSEPPRTTAAAVERPLLAPPGLGYPDPAPQVGSATPEERLAQMLSLLLGERAPTQPRHGSNPLTVGLTDEKLFKMEGARGRLAQDRLDQQLREGPGMICAEFEAAIRREAPAEDPNERDISLGQLQRAWRQTVPAKEHPLVVRVAEALLHVYHHLRAGRRELGMARVALLLAGLEQGVRDNGRVDKRGDLLMSMPPPPLALYHAHSQEEKQALKDDKKGLGGMARLVGAGRATTARAVFLENAGA